MRTKGFGHAALHVEARKAQEEPNRPTSHQDDSLPTRSMILQMVRAGIFNYSEGLRRLAGNHEILIEMLRTGQGSVVCRLSDKGPSEKTTNAEWKKISVEDRLLRLPCTASDS